ncbi:hypothetical protein [Cellulomonas sp. Root137]|uniref:hypothetical protein n=1 Tax=Cellulomonas sp. Root137 TaxID=1736459 RepID=UPI0006F4EED4|nr:hypothetical protein [Cellulomonas sp. Root137]KQY42926.1 hypothetical protein ASD18_18290 [Cellulomonas sp. Root137]
MLTPHSLSRATTAAAGRGGAVVLAAVLVLGATAGCTAPRSDPDAAASPSSSATRESAGTGADATDRPTDDASAPGAASTQSSESGGAEEFAGEIMPSQPPGPSGLPDTAVPGPSLTGPLPATGAANGAVVTGFPTGVVPIVDGLTVVSSSVSASGDRLQVGLQASSDSAPTDVQAAYVAALSAAGFTVGDSPALPGSLATSFTRGPDALVLTVRDRLGGGTELSVAGALTTAG